MSTQRTLEDALRVIYSLQRDAAVDDVAAGIWARVYDDDDADPAWMVDALRTAGGPVAWMDREPTSPADDTPYVIASIDEASGRVRFIAATAAQCRGVRGAYQYDVDGDHLDQDNDED